MAVANKKKNGRLVGSNIYTALLALACGIVLATAGFVAFVCHSQYGTLFKVSMH